MTAWVKEVRKHGNSDGPADGEIRDRRRKAWRRQLEERSDDGRSGRCGEVDAQLTVGIIRRLVAAAVGNDHGRSGRGRRHRANLTAVSGSEQQLAQLDGIGVGPHPEPWPDNPRFDPELLREGDRRNVVDRYRYWSLEAIVADLDQRRHPFHVAIENWEHDFNIGTVVRNANAFLAAEVHIIGRRRWNRRGAMVTDRYQHICHHSDVAEFAAWCSAESLPIVGIDNLPGSTPIETTTLPERCVLMFGQEGPGLSDAARTAATATCSIAQFGSTRSINAGVASGIAMHAWIVQHATLPLPAQS